MANNPFYPGYSPKKESDIPINPIFPGYYAGQPLQRPPSSKNFLGPIEYSGDALIEHIDRTVGLAANEVTGLPRKIVNLVLDDFKDSLKVAIKPAYVNIAEMDDYNMDDLPGPSGVSLSLNPFDYTEKEAKKTISKTINDWVKKTTGINTKDLLSSDFTDIENKTRQSAWRLAVGYGEEKAPFETASGAAIAERVAAIGYETTGTEKNPLNLKGYDTPRYIKRDPVDGSVVYNKYTKRDKAGKPIKDALGNEMVVKDEYHPQEKDIFKKVANKLGVFEQTLSSPVARDKNHDDFLTEAVSVTNKEIQAKYHTWLERTAKSSDNPQKLQTIKDTFERHSGAVAMFDMKNGLLSDIGKLQYSITETNKTLKGNVLTGRVLDTEKLTELGDTVNKSKEKLEIRLNKAKELYKQGRVSAEAYQSLVLYSNKYEGFLKRIENPVKEAVSGKIDHGSVIKVLDSVANVKSGGGLAGGDIYRHGLERQLLKNMELDMIAPKTHKNISGQEVIDQIGFLLQDGNLRGLDVNIESSKLAPLVYRLRMEKVEHGVREFLDSWDDGKLVENYLWNNRIKPRIKAYLPTTFLGTYLEERNYFGLMITKKGIARLKEKGDIGKLGRYAFRIKAKFDDDFSAKWGVNKALLRGGDHFEIFGNSLLSNFINKKDLTEAERVKFLDGLLKTNIFFEKFDATGKSLNSGKIHILESELAQKLFGVSIKNITDEDGSLKLLHDFKEQFENFNIWYNKNAKAMFGKATDDGTFGVALFLQLHKKNRSLPSSYKLGRAYIGSFEKLHKKMEEIQKAIMASKFAKYIAMIQNWKDIVGNKIASLVTQLIAKAVDAAATASGVGTVLIPVIEAAVKFTVKKILTYGEALLKGIVKADFGDLRKLMEKETEKAIKAFMIFILIIALPIAVFSGLFFGVFNASVSPVDQTAISTEYCTKGSNDYVSSVNTFVTSNENTQGQIIISYTLSVTPRTCISSDYEITWTAKTYAIQSVGGEDYTILLQQKSGDVSYAFLGNGDPNYKCNVTREIPVTLDPVEKADIENSTILNIVEVHIPIIEGVINACEEQVIVAKASTSIGGGGPGITNFDECDGYKTGAMVCLVNTTP